MGNWLGAPLLVLAAILQVTFTPQIRIFGGEPDLIFLIVLSWAANARLEQGVAWAFVGGITYDLLSAGPTGASVPGLVAAVFLVDVVRRQLFSIGLISLLLLVALGTLVNKLFYIAVLIIAGFNVRPFDLFGYVVLPTLAYNLVAILPVYWFVRRMRVRTPDARVAG